MKNHFKNINISSTRISAFDSIYVDEIIKSTNYNNINDISQLLSHLKAIYYASQLNGKYFLGVCVRVQY